MFDAEKILRDERANLIHQLSELGANDDGPLRDDVSYGEGFADAAAATAERTEVIGLVESVKTMLDNVDAALERIAEGTYGTCAECGKKIAKARIEFRPESIYCVDCKAKS
jgi:RNA polymerase-binding transcription factor DksA